MIYIALGEITLLQEELLVEKCVLAEIDINLKQLNKRLSYERNVFQVSNGVYIIRRCAGNIEYGEDVLVDHSVGDTRSISEGS